MTSDEGEFLQDKVFELLPLIKEAARVVAAQWPDTVVADDVEQEIALRLLTSPRSVDRLLDEMEPARRKTALIKIGHQIAARERVEYEVFSGQYQYGTREIADLLSSGVLGAERTEVSATLIDLDEGLELVSERNPRYAGLLVAVFRDGDDTAHRQVIARAVELLTESMNRVSLRRARERDGIGSRKVGTNVHTETADWLDGIAGDFE